MEIQRRPHSLFWPFLLIVVGIFLLLSTLNVLEGNTWDLVLKLWPLLLVVGGLDGLYRLDGFAGPVVLIGLGAIFLLANFGYVDVSAWILFLRLWPAILIGFGLDLLVGRRSIWSAVSGVLLGLVIVAAIIWFAIIQPVGLAPSSTQTISQDLQGANSAVVSIESPVGNLSVGSGAKSGQLVDGSLSLLGGENIQQEYTTSAGKGSYTLKSAGNFVSSPFSGASNQAAWNVMLAGDVPLDLTAKMIVGENQVDLSGLQVEHLDVETVIGKNVVILPAQGSLDGSAETVIGELVIMVPRDAVVQIQADTGIAGVALPQGYTKEGNTILSPSAGNASPRINLSANVPIGALRIEYIQ